MELLYGHAGRFGNPTWPGQFDYHEHYVDFTLHLLPQIFGGGGKNVDENLNREKPFFESAKIAEVRSPWAAQPPYISSVSLHTKQT